MKTQTVPNVDQTNPTRLGVEEKISIDCIGPISGIPLPRETIALIAMKAIYDQRTSIIEDLALKMAPELIVWAQELANALLIFETLLDQAGIITEREIRRMVGDNDLTYLESAADVLESDFPEDGPPRPDDKQHCELREKVNRQFRPWLISPKTRAGRSRKLAA